MPIPVSSASGATHGALVPIAYQNTNTTPSTIVFNNIPQGYQDLEIVFTGHMTSSNRVCMYINSDTGTNYSFTSACAGYTAVNYYTGYNNYNYLCIGGLTNGSGTYYPGFSKTYIQNYTGNTYKTVISRFMNDRNDQGTGNVENFAGLWLGTSAITSLTFYPGAGSWASGTSIALYGVRGVGQ